MERSRRNVQSRTAKLAGVLDQLKAARDGSGPKRASVYEVKQEDAVFDVVDEEQYEQLVTKRRLETGEPRAAAARGAALCARDRAWRAVCNFNCASTPTSPRRTACWK